MPLFNHNEKPVFVGEDPLTDEQRELSRRMKRAIIGGKRGVRVLAKLAPLVIKEWGFGPEEK